MRRVDSRKSKSSRSCTKAGRKVEELCRAVRLRRRKKKLRSVARRRSPWCRRHCNQRLERALGAGPAARAEPS
jgi:hypothetical protein